MPTVDGTVELDATIRVVDANDVVASYAQGGSFEGMADTFRAWVDGRAARASANIRWAVTE